MQLPRFDDLEKWGNRIMQVWLLAWWGIFTYFASSILTAAFVKPVAVLPLVSIAIGVLIGWLILAYIWRIVLSKWGR